MKEFLNRLFHRKKKRPAAPETPASLPETEIDREIEALYGILADILGSDKLVIKAGKMDAMTLMRSPLRGERVLALQRIILENPTIEEIPKEGDIPAILHALTSEVADIVDTYVYRMSFASSGSFSLSSAAGLFKSVINFILIVLANRFARKFGEEGVY